MAQTNGKVEARNIASLVTPTDGGKKRVQAISLKAPSPMLKADPSPPRVFVPTPPKLGRQNPKKRGVMGKSLDDLGLGGIGETPYGQ
jgi:hypothetical protein